MPIIAKNYFAGTLFCVAEAKSDNAKFYFMSFIMKTYLKRLFRFYNPLHQQNFKYRLLVCR